MQIIAYQEKYLTRTAVMWFASLTDALPYVEPRHSYQQVYTFFRDVIVPQNDIWLALEDEDLKGFMAIQSEYLTLLYIAVDAQRQGIGSALLDKARALSSDGLTSHTYQRNEMARAFYRKHGFTEVKYGLVADYNNEPDVEIRWEKL